MATSFAFKSAAARIEVIADELGKTARNGFNTGAEHRDIVRQMGFNPYNLAGNEQNYIALEITKRQKAYNEQATQRSILLVNELRPREQEVEAEFETNRPRRDTSTPAAIMLSQERWNAALARVEAGESLNGVIASADLATVLAAEAFAADYLMSKNIRGGMEALMIDRAAQEAEVRLSVERMVLRRLEEIADPAVRDLIAVYRRARGFASIAWERAKHLSRVLEGRPSDALGSAVAVEQISRAYGISQSPSEQRLAVNQAASQAATAESFPRHWAARN